MVDFAGGAAAAGALKPPDKADNHEDDKGCPDPEKKCSECAGKLQFCTEGDASGCMLYPAPLCGLCCR